MKARLLASLVRSIATAAAVWAIVGVPVAAVIAACRVFVWVIFSLPDMAATALVLGAVHGLWLYLVGRPSESKNLGWLGSISGAILGVLGFAIVFSRINSVVADRPLVVVSLLAAVCGGLAAGFASARIVIVPETRRSSLASSIIGFLLLIPLTALDYNLYWPSTVDRLPVLRLSHQVVTHLTAGDARGSTWAGCYQYLGHLSHGSGVLGGEGGLLEVEQVDGSLKVRDGSAGPLQGEVDSTGHFRFWC
jgi:hypothetical protein